MRDGAALAAGAGVLRATRSPSPSVTTTMSTDIATEPMRDRISPREYAVAGSVRIGAVPRRARIGAGSTRPSTIAGSKQSIAVTTTKRYTRGSLMIVIPTSAMGKIDTSCPIAMALRHWSGLRGARTASAAPASSRS